MYSEMSTARAFIPGRSPPAAFLLRRYLPPIPGGMATTWLHNHLPPGSWVLDPFGVSPELVTEIASAGYRVLVAAYNPILRFLIELRAGPPTADQLRAALADLAMAKKGDKRMETHIQSLYLTRCEKCQQEVPAEAFVWERAEDAPFRRIYHCPHCGERFTTPCTPFDVQRAQSFAQSGLHRARALERVTPMHDPDRPHAQAALEVYLPRTVYAIFTLINKIDGLPVSEERKRHLYTLLLYACDQGNKLWMYPSGRPRPRQLTTSPRFYEHNVWKAMEECLEHWAHLKFHPVPLAHWPDTPPESGGVLIFDGRFKQLAPLLDRLNIAAILTTIPRPNQAFWSLSAIWAGWLWGAESIHAFKQVLRRRRYDWSWHTSALHIIWHRIQQNLPAGLPVFALLGEAEPGFITAALMASHLAGMRLEGLAYRTDIELAQFHWRTQEKPAFAPRSDSSAIAQKAIQQLLQQRGEPTSYDLLHFAALANLITEDGWAQVGSSAGEMYSQAHQVILQSLTQTKGFFRYGGSEHAPESGLWWMQTPDQANEALANRVERQLVSLLQNHPGITYTELDAKLCESYPGLLTPTSDLLRVCLESYGEQQPANREELSLYSTHWVLRGQDEPETRRQDTATMLALLQEMGQRMGYQVGGEAPLCWQSSAGELAYAFYVLTSAILSQIVLSANTPPNQSVIVLPGGRANLALFKIQRDPRLKAAIDQGWRFLKFRQVRRMAESHLFSKEMIEEQLRLDPLTYTEPQIPLL